VPPISSAFPAFLRRRYGGNSAGKLPQVVPLAERIMIGRKPGDRRGPGLPLHGSSVRTWAGSRSPSLASTGPVTSEPGGRLGEPGLTGEQTLGAGSRPMAVWLPGEVPHGGLAALGGMPTDSAETPCGAAAAIVSRYRRQYLGAYRIRKCLGRRNADSESCKRAGTDRDRH